MDLFFFDMSMFEDDEYQSLCLIIMANLMRYASMQHKLNF